MEGGREPGAEDLRPGCKTLSKSVKGDGNVIQFIWGFPTCVIAARTFLEIGIIIPISQIGKGLSISRPSSGPKCIMGQI